MKKILLFASLCAALLVWSENAHAQYLPSSLHQEKGALVGQDGHRLSSQEVLLAIGEDLYEETYTGAVKQYAAGKKLILGGAIGLGVGLVGTIASTAILSSCPYTEYADGHIEFDDSDTAGLAAMGIVAGCIVTGLGGTALSAGIPLKVIGKKRLEWLADNYNVHQEGITLRIGSAPHGLGMVLDF